MNSNSELIGQLYSLRAGLSVLSEQKNKLDELLSPAMFTIEDLIMLFPSAYKQHFIIDRFSFDFVCWDQQNTVDDILKINKIIYVLDNFPIYNAVVSILECLFFRRTTMCNYEYLKKLAKEYNIKGFLEKTNDLKDKTGEFYAGDDELFELANNIYNKWITSQEAYQHYLTMYSDFKRYIQKQQQDFEEYKRAFSRKSSLIREIETLKNTPFLSFRKTIKNELANKEQQLSLIEDKPSEIKQKHIDAYNEAIKLFDLVIELFNKSKEHKERVESQVNILKESAEKMLETLIDEFSNIVDIRDWKNLDLIIYSIETGRADTIKEALQFVDNEIRLSRLETAIQEATKQITEMLAYGFRSIRSSVESCFNRLSTQMAIQHSEVIDTLNSNNAIISSQISELISTARACNALQAKANVNSSQLMSDIKYIRTYMFH